MKARPSPFRVPGAEARELIRQKREATLRAELDRLTARSTWWRRLLCLLLTHRPWPTGIVATAPSGEVYRLHACRRCGRRFAQLPETIDAWVTP